MLALTLVAGLALGADAIPAAAATTVGQTFTPVENCSTNLVHLATQSPGNEYIVPSDGVLTSWQYQAPAAPPALKFKVGRTAGGSSFTIVGESAIVTPSPSALNTFAVRLAVRAGDVLGLYAVSGGPCGQAVGGFGFHYVTGDQAPGSTTTYTFLAGHQFDVAAILEPDADADGFGDESQDQCPGVTGSANGCVPVVPDTDPPETTITKRPKAKTEKTTAKFKFTSSEANSTFQCKLKGKGLDTAVKHFGFCSSPRKYKHLDPGKYKFFVFATDAAGNPDATPATQKFRVLAKG